MTTLNLKIDELAELSVILGNRIIELENSNTKNDAMVENIVTRQLTQAKLILSSVDEILFNHHAGLEKIRNDRLLGIMCYYAD